MRRSWTVAAVFASAALVAVKPASAQDTWHPEDALNRIAPLLSSLVSPYKELPRPVFTPPSPVRVGAVPEADSGPLVKQGLWETLQAPEAPSAQLIASNFSEIDMSQVREIPFAAVKPLADKAVRRGYDILDFLTDEGFRSSRIFYIGRDTLRAFYTSYRFKAIMVQSGITTRKQPFELQALLIGDGRVRFLYDLDDFKFRQTEFKRNFILSRKITCVIAGPGDLDDIDGIQVSIGIFQVSITELKNNHDGFISVVTPWGSRTHVSTPLTPVSSGATSPGQDASF